MGGGPVVTAGVHDASFAHLLDPKRKWYNNKRSAGRLVVYPTLLLTCVFNRIILLNAWIFVLCVPFVSLQESIFTHTFQLDYILYHWL